jgi:putative NAD(P)H nitroreductase
MELKEILESRRAVNFFDKERDIDESVIRQIYDLAKFTPTSFNLQPVKIILVHDQAGKEKLKQAAFNQPKIGEAPYTAILLGNKKAYEQMDPILDDFVSKGYYPASSKDTVKGMAKNLYSGENERAFVGRNVGLFAMTFMLAAKSLGIDSHPMDGMDAAAVKKAFNVPDDYDVVMLIALGYFQKDKTLLTRAARRSFEEAVVRETF